MLLVIVSLLCVLPLAGAQRPTHTTSQLLSGLTVHWDVEPGISIKAEPFVILVKSSIRNHEERRSIRETWGQEIRPIFVLGYSTETAVMTAAANEHVTHGDMIMGSFEDQYFQLTLKSVFILSWMQSRHPDKWLLAVDDDAVVNVRILRQFIGRVSDPHSVQCHLWAAVSPIRWPYNKWYVDKRTYPSSRYPDYCSGRAILYPPTAVDRLLHACLDPETEPKLWLDDLFVTGIAAETANVTRVHSKSINPFLHADDCQAEQLVTMIAGAQYRPTELRSLWIAMQHLLPTFEHDTLSRCRHVALVSKVLACIILAAIASALLVTAFFFEPSKNRIIRPFKRVVRFFRSRSV